MSDLKATADAPASASVTTEIERAMGSIWERRVGTRPASVNAEFSGDSIRCVIEEGEADPAADGEEAAAELGGTDTGAYRHETRAAVSRITRRSVSAYVAKRDKQTGNATQTFILERTRTKY